MIAVHANASAVKVLSENAAGAGAEILEHAERLSTGDWRRLVTGAEPAVSVRITDGWCDVAIEWPDVQMMAEGPTIIVTITSTTIPVTLASAAAERSFRELADVGRLAALNGLRIEHVISGEATVIVMSDKRRAAL